MAGNGNRVESKRGLAISIGRVRESVPSGGEWGSDRGGGSGRLSAAVIGDVGELQSLRAAWDDLAVQTGSPFGAPAWLESWWRHLAPPGAQPAIVVVREGECLVGLAPFYATRKLGIGELRLIGGGWASRLGILGLPGREPEIGKAIALVLAASDPRPDLIRWEGIDAESAWPEAISTGWPGEKAHRITEESRRGAPVLPLDRGTYEDWFAGKSSHFRRHMRRARREIEKEGAVFRFADRDSLVADLEAFERLHTARRDSRGGSTAFDPGAAEALREVGEELIESGRFRISIIDGPDGEPISAQLFVAAGGDVAFWNAGFDEAWYKHSPGLLTVLAAIEDAYARGDELMDFGGGEASYKDRICDEDRPIAWRTSFLPGPRYPLARMRRLPGQVARSGANALRSRLGQERFERLRGRLRR